MLCDWHRSWAFGRVVIPPDAGVGSAHGFLDAPIAYEVVRTLLVRIDRLDTAALDQLFAEMRAEAEAVVRLGVPSGDLTETRMAFMRYRGQGHEVAVPVPAGPVEAVALRASFDATYARVYGRVIPGLEVEAVTWTLALAQPFGAAGTTGRHQPPVAAPRPRAAGSVIDPASGAIPRTPRCIRGRLCPRARRLTGPAIIVEAGTSTIVPPGFSACASMPRANC